MADHSMTVAEIAAVVSGRVVGDGQTVIRGLAKIEDAGPDELSFVANPKYVRYLEESKAGAILVASGMLRSSGATIEVSDPYIAFVKLLEKFHSNLSAVAKGVHKTAVVDSSAKLGDNVAIAANCVIEKNVNIGTDTILHANVFIGSNTTIGDNCEIHANVSVREGTRIGNRIIIQNGAVIGSDGFGFAAEDQKFRKIPQVGIVVLQDDVEIGANTTIDRATLGQTVIGEGTKIDNLCQIAHNVVIGKHCVIAAQSGVSGSTVIGNNCKVGGQVGFVGHLKIGDGAMFGAQAGVASDVAAGEIVSGSPARAHMLWKRIEAALTRLPDLLRRVRRIEETLEKSGRETKGVHSES